MRIWVDGQCFQSNSNIRGIGRYVADFLRSLDAIGHVQLVISLNGSMREETIAARAYLKQMVPGAQIEVWFALTEWGEVQSGYSSEHLADERILIRHINSLNVDVALSPSPFEGEVERVVPFINTNGVTALTACIFHDAIPYRYPDVYLKEESRHKCYMRRFEKISSFDIVLCNSEFTKSEYVSIFGRDNAISISAALSDGFRAQLTGTYMTYVDAEHIARSASLGNYVLYVGGVDWRKNLPFLVRAMSQVPECISGTLKLVLAGYIHVNFPPLQELWTQLGLSRHNIVATGWVSEAELIELYRRAIVTIQPSLMEGFGLTALEAMAAGSPFLAARAGASIEVVARDDLLFNPYVTPDLAQKISRMLNDINYRSEVIEYGLERVQQFSWAHAATLALDSIDSAAAQHISSFIGSESNSSLDNDIIDNTPRLIMDISSTAQSPVLSGIQRVMIRLSEEMTNPNRKTTTKVDLSYCRNKMGWFHVRRLDKQFVSLDPTNLIAVSTADKYLLLDSSWVFVEGQRSRLVDALVLGQEVIHGIHDIGPLTMSAMTDAGMPRAFRVWFEFILGHSTGLICVSRAVADEVYELLCAIRLPRPMKIGYFRLGSDFSQAAPDPGWLGNINQRPTILMVGTIEPRKGHSIALDAFTKLWADNFDINLLIVGKAGWDTRLLRERLEAHPEYERRLFVRTGLDDGQLRAAYENATALLMTSYLEGFGLPLVEAANLGCQVVATDIPVFREIGQYIRKITYFRIGDSADLADKIEGIVSAEIDNLRSPIAEWPTWAESAKEIHEVIFEGNWYHYYEPEAIQPNVKLGDIGAVAITRALEATERVVECRFIEGPLLSDDGSELRFAVAVKNVSKVIWSSYRAPSGGFDINLGSHIYAENGTCLHYENERTPIPFVLYPSQEILLPVRVSTDWLTKGARTVGVELVQESVAWFGESMRFSLVQSPPLSGAQPKGDATSLRPRLFRGPFGKDVQNEQYFLFALFNASSATIQFKGSSGRDVVGVGLRDKLGRAMAGAWLVNQFDEISPAGYGLICVYLSGRVADEAATLVLELKNDDDSEGDVEWALNLATAELRQLLIDPGFPTAGANIAQTEVDLRGVDEFAEIAFDKDSLHLAVRGFHECEATHTWMNGKVGEINLSGFWPDARPVRRIEIHCAAINGLPEPLELTLSVDETEIGKLIISPEFMAHSLRIKPELNDLFGSQSKMLTITSNQAKVEEGGERILSVCLSKIFLYLE